MKGTEWVKENTIPLILLGVMAAGAYTTNMVMIKSSESAIFALNERVEAQGVHIANLGMRMNGVERNGDKAIAAVESLVKATSDLALTNGRLVISVAKLEVQLSNSKI